MKIKVIYAGGYIPDLAICLEDGAQRGWLVYRHPDGQWVTLVDLKEHLEALADTEEDE